MGTQIGFGTTLERETQTEHATGPGSKAHIVKEPEDGSKTAQAMVTEARVMGIELEALCGYRWIPNKSPAGLPTCDLCVEMYRALTNDKDGLPEE